MSTIKFILLICLLSLIGCQPNYQAEGVRKLLLEQIDKTHTNKDWFVPLTAAIAGLSTEQAHFKDSLADHSICELVSHITFWNERMLLGLLSQPPKPYDDNNEETFDRYCYEDWSTTVSKADSVQAALAQAVRDAKPDQLKEWNSSLANMTAHIAYHTGQIVYLRKVNDWWDHTKGVK